MKKRVFLVIKKQSTILKIRPIKLQNIFIGVIVILANNANRTKPSGSFTGIICIETTVKIDNTNIRTSKLFGDKPTKPPKISIN